MKVKITYTKVVMEEIDIAVDGDSEELSKETIDRIGEYLEAQINPSFVKDIQGDILQLEIPDIGFFFQ